ncbi:DeoR/GlpR family DNA-binding transcription regulator [Enterococcus sp. LJL120]
MLTDERRQKILEALDRQQLIKSQDLMDQLSASESTIRRDLQELEDAGLLTRIHGGAKIIEPLGLEPNLNEKTFKNLHEKQAIVQMALTEIREDDIIYLDAGSTTLEFIPFLKDKRIVVVTNSVRHANELVDLNIETIILGGSIKLTTNAVLGNFAIAQLQQMRFNCAFMGMNGIHETFGLTTPDPEEGALKQMAMAQAEKVFVLADDSKFNKTSFFKVADVSSATIITNYCPAEYLPALKKQTTIKEAIK